ETIVEFIINPINPAKPNILANIGSSTNNSNVTKDISNKDPEITMELTDELSQVIEKMANASEEWLKKAVPEGHINYIEYNSFTYIKRIGEGGFGSVSKYEWNGCKLTVALKCLKAIDEPL